MEYISTRNTKKTFSFKDIFLNSLASDGGLYVPNKIPFYSIQNLEKFRNLSYQDLAVKIISDFCAEEFKESEIENLIDKSYKNFRIQEVIRINKIGKINLLELFHGPTLAFKDIAMQAIGNMYETILEKNKLQINVIVATSGDTGAAAIEAIKNRKNIKIFVLHPENKISEVQRKFMTTVSSPNVFNIALDGIKEKINFSVPTGNFGDIYAGYIAKKMGLPISKLVVATNKNDILKRVINTGLYKPSKVEQTVSPSMDIQVASNFERLIFDVNSCNSEKTSRLMNEFTARGEFKIEETELKKIKQCFSSESLSEKETKTIIRDTYKNHGVLIDPHTAVGIGVVKKIPLEGNTVVLATAHPAKFPEVVMESTGIKPELPEKLKYILSEKENYDKLPKDLDKIKKYILEKI